MGKSLKTILLVIPILCFGIVAYGQEASAASLYNDGLEKLKAKEYEEALTLLEQALETADPESDQKVIKLAKRNSAFASYYIGNKHRKAKEYDEALAAYQKGIEYSPGLYSNFVGVAQSLEGQEKDAEAVTAYIKAAEMTRKAGKEDRADKLISKAENFAGIAWGKKQWDKTIACAEAFLAEMETPDAHFYMAEGLKAKKQNEKALEHIAKSVELAGDGEKDKYYFSKAEVHEALGEKAKAIQTYKMVSGETYGERARYKADQLEGSR